ncbi:MAG TPA: hypothetical protein VF660_05795 [Actinomycetota bacterium]
MIERSGRSPRMGVNGAGAMLIAGGVVGGVTGWLLFGVASLAGVAFALLAALLIVFSVVQIVAGIRIIRLATGLSLATWTLAASAVLLVLSLFKEPFAAVLALIVDGVAFLALRESAPQFERREGE